MLYSRSASGRVAEMGEKQTALLRTASGTREPRSHGPPLGRLPWCSLYGRVAEWLKAPVSKTGRLERVSRVQISPLPQ